MSALLAPLAGEAPTPLPAEPPTLFPVEPMVELVDLRHAEPVSHYDRSRLIQCETGTVLANLVTLEPDVPPSDDAPRRMTVRELCLGRNVQWNEDHTAVVATVGGKVVVAGNKISVEHLLEIGQDVGFNVGNIDFDGDVVVRKNVLERFKVHASGNISIGGTADEADLLAKGHIQVGGGVVGKGKGTLVSGGDTHAHFISQASVKVGGNLFVHNEIAGSTVRCAGEVDVSHGSILSSTISAAGVKCHTVGSQGIIKTIIELGGEEELLQAFQDQTTALHDLRVRRAALQKEIGRLQIRQKQLNAREKESLTELLFECDELNTQIAGVTKTLNNSYEQSRSRKGVSLQVSSRLLAGVIIRCPGYETVIRDDLRGPVTVLARRDAKDGGFVAIDMLRKSIMPLPTHRTADEVHALLIKLHADEQV